MTRCFRSVFRWAWKLARPTGARAVPIITVTPVLPETPAFQLAAVLPALEFMAALGCDVEAKVMDAGQPRNELTLRMVALPPPPMYFCNARGRRRWSVRLGHVTAPNAPNREPGAANCT